MHIYSHSELSGERVLANQMRHSWKRLRFSENKPTERENRAKDAVELSLPRLVEQRCRQKPQAGQRDLP